MFHRSENDGKTERKVGKLLGRTSWFRPATKNYERGHLSNCCNPYTGSRLVNKGSEVQGRCGSEVVIALDAVALYPSIRKDVAMALCKQAALETSINIQHINLLEATRLLVLMWPEKKIRDSSIRKYLPVRRREPGKRVGKQGLTTENSFHAVPNNRNQWIWPETKVPKDVQKEIFACVVEEFVGIFCDT